MPKFLVIENVTKRFYREYEVWANSPIEAEEYYLDEGTLVANDGDDGDVDIDLRVEELTETKEGEKSCRTK